MLSIFGFYTVQLLATFRKGILEKGWKKVTEGAVILVLAQIPFLAAGIASPAFGSLLLDIGAIFRFIGIVFLILGFRAQHNVWRLDNKDSSRDIESSIPTQNYQRE